MLLKSAWISSIRHVLPSRGSFSERAPMTIIRKIAPKDPTEALSVGVAIPAMIDPSTAMIKVIGGNDDILFHLRTNLRFGCVILRHYIDRERGDLFMALGRYNGSRGRSPYPDAVFRAQRNWLFAEGSQLPAV